MLFGIGLGVTLIALIIATITDLKTREVPDWLTHGLIGVGIGVRVVVALFSSSWTPLLEGLYGFAVFFGVGYLLYRLGQWGGGDAKLLGGMGVLFGLTPSPGDFMAGFIINLLIMGGLWGTVYGLTKIQSWKLQWYELVTVILVVLAVIILFFVSYIEVALIVLLLGMLIVLFPKLLTIEKNMVRSVTVKELTEGDWLKEDVKQGKKVIVAKKGIGLTVKQIALLQKSSVKKVKIKDGVPFVPSFLLAFLLTLGFNLLLFL